MQPLISSISDTARWVAVYRARETERADALFRDPYARRLAGDRGEEIALAHRFTEQHSWPMIMNGTSVFRAARARVTNCSADSKSSDAIPMSAPLFRTPFMRT